MVGIFNPASIGSYVYYFNIPCASYITMWCTSSSQTFTPENVPQLACANPPPPRTDKSPPPSPPSSISSPPPSPPSFISSPPPSPPSYISSPPPSPPSVVNSPPPSPPSVVSSPPPSPPSFAPPPRPPPSSGSVLLNFITPMINCQANSQCLISSVTSVILLNSIGDPLSITCLDLPGEGVAISVNFQSQSQSNSLFSAVRVTWLCAMTNEQDTSSLVILLAFPVAEESNHLTSCVFFHQ